ncbi:hypothetical protein GCM10009547_45320 [Sporichthya brevicatena]|uniref:Uncharacterized protein n=1 Tax=Sporichthya brevicatena TaxID=171442 RepID=A0ABN1HAU7_9ACTN
MAVSGAAALLVVAPLLATTQAAASDVTFDAFADAYGVDITFSNESVPLGIIPQGAGPVGHAHLASLGDSDAYASFPYPGDTATGLPGTAGALAGFPTPQYPMYVATQAGDTPKSQDLPGVSLRAESGSSLARGRGVVGTDGYGSNATATVERLADNSVRSDARTMTGATVLDYFQVTGVRSEATVIGDSSNGELTRTSHLSISRISVPGLSIPIPPTTPTSAPIPVPIPGAPQLPPLTFPPMPLPMGGTTLHEPELGFVNGTFVVTMPAEGPNGASTTYALPHKPVVDALKAQGITMTFQGAQNFATGIVAPTVAFSYTMAAPPANQYYNGPTEMTVVFGRSIAAVDMFRGDADAAIDTVDSTSGSTDAAGATLPSTDVATADLAALAGAGLTTTPAGTIPTVNFAGGGVSAEPAAVTRAFQYDLSLFYLLFVAISAVAVAAAAVRKMGA